jgi:hypothetical protein
LPLQGGHVDVDLGSRVLDHLVVHPSLGEHGVQLGQTIADRLDPRALAA